MKVKKTLFREVYFSHSWILMDHPREEDRILLPNKEFGDIYRSMTVLPRLCEYYYPTGQNTFKSDVESISEKEYEGLNLLHFICSTYILYPSTESLKPKSPNIRANRRIIRRRAAQRYTPRNLMLGFMGMRDGCSQM